MLNIGIVGAGKGGKAILKTLLSVSDVNIIGICDPNFSAPGITLAKEKNVPIYKDFNNLIMVETDKIIIEVTGNHKLRDLLLSTADERTKIVDSSIALLICQIVDSRELMINKLESESANLSNLAGHLSALIQETSTTSKINSQSLNETVQNLNNTAYKNQNHINETNQIISFIKKVANQTKMLGFNAAIEANRAGYEGNGFRVVANEIRKLADETGHSVQQITHFINELNQSTEETIANIENIQKQTNDFVVNQNKISDTLTDASMQIEDLSLTLSDLSQK